MNKIRKIGEVSAAMFLALILSLTLGAIYSGSATPSQSAPAAVVQAVSAPSASELPMAESLAVYYGPTGCYHDFLNNMGAWPAAYVRCSGGSGKYQAVGGFRRWNGTIYYGWGNCVGIGQISKVSSGALFEPAVSSGWKRC